MIFLNKLFFIKDKTRIAYEKWAKNFDLDINPHLILEHDFLLAAIDVKKNEKVLDAGCGTGRYLEEFLKSKSIIVGFDFSKEMIFLAKKKFPSVRFVNGDLKKRLPFKNSTFDKVNCSQVLDHIENIEYVLSEFYRVLKPGGKLVFSANHPDVDWHYIRYNGDYHSIDIFGETDIFYHSLSDYLAAIGFAKFSLNNTIQIPISKKIKKFLTKESYRKVEGMYEIIIFELDKPRF